jgi:hypothetical protein
LVELSGYPLYTYRFSDTNFDDGTAVVGSFDLGTTLAPTPEGGLIYDLDVSAHGVNYTLQNARVDAASHTFNLISIFQQSPPQGRLEVWFPYSGGVYGFLTPASSFPVSVWDTLNGSLANGTLVREGDIFLQPFPEPATWLWLAIMLLPLLRWRR